MIKTLFLCLDVTKTQTLSLKPKKMQKLEKITITTVSTTTSKIFHKWQNSSENLKHVTNKKNYQTTIPTTNFLITKSANKQNLANKNILPVKNNSIEEIKSTKSYENLPNSYENFKESKEILTSDNDNELPTQKHITETPQQQSNDAKIANKNATFGNLSSLFCQKFTIVFLIISIFSKKYF